MGLTAATLPLHAQLSFTFGSGADTFAMDFVFVANAGNPADTTGIPNPAGSVSHVYRMGKYEVSEDMIDKANSAGGLGITKDLRGANQPATSITWIEAAKFVNWLNTSTGRQPAYKFDGSGAPQLWSSAEAWQAGGENLFRHRDAYFFLPSENEWYKAAYFNGAAGVYFDYPTGSDTPPTGVGSGTAAGTAVVGQVAPADIAQAGGLGPYGTMAQGGNVWEWTETAADQVNDNPSELRSMRGSWWGFPAASTAASLSAEVGSVWPAEFVNPSVGFRVAAVPEPSGFAVAFGGLTFGLALRRRRATG